MFRACLLFWCLFPVLQPKLVLLSLYLQLRFVFFFCFSYCPYIGLLITWPNANVLQWLFVTCLQHMFAAFRARLLVRIASFLETLLRSAFRSGSGRLGPRADIVRRFPAVRCRVCASLLDFLKASDGFGRLFWMFRRLRRARRTLRCGCLCPSPAVSQSN